MELNLNGKVALVMGSSAGIGKAVAQSMAQEGCKVVICSRNLDSLAKVAEEVGADSFFAVDLTKPGESRRLVQEVLSKYGRLDILVTNTGGPAKGNFLQVSLDQWQQDFQSLWLSVVEALHEALPKMVEHNYGRVLMVTSIAAARPLPGLTTSNGLRAGLEGLARSMAVEYAKDGVTFNLLLPGYTNTDRLKALNLSEEKVRQMVPAGRLADPSELADLATYLASEKGAYITGQSIAIDGGSLI